MGKYEFLGFLDIIIVSVERAFMVAPWGSVGIGIPRFQAIFGFSVFWLVCHIDNSKYPAWR